MEKPAAAMDCEMVAVAGISYDPSDPITTASSAVCRVSVVELTADGTDFSILLDLWIDVQEQIVDFRTTVTGEDSSSYWSRDRVPRWEAREAVAKIMKDRVIVGHALWNDLCALQLMHPPELIRDTALYKSLRPPWRRNILPSLSLLTNYWLGECIHDGVHNPIQDALSALRLYKLVQSGLPSSRRNGIYTAGTVVFHPPPTDHQHRAAGMPELDRAALSSSSAATPETDEWNPCTDAAVWNTFHCQDDCVDDNAAEKAMRMHQQRGHGVAGPKDCPPGEWLFASVFPESMPTSFDASNGWICQACSSVNSAVASECEYCEQFYVDRSSTTPGVWHGGGAAESYIWWHPG